MKYFPINSRSVFHPIPIIITILIFVPITNQTAPNRLAENQPPAGLHCLNDFFAKFFAQFFAQLFAQLFAQFFPWLIHTMSQFSQKFNNGEKWDLNDFSYKFSPNFSPLCNALSLYFTYTRGQKFIHNISLGEQGLGRGWRGPLSLCHGQSLRSQYVIRCINFCPSVYLVPIFQKYVRDLINGNVQIMQN